MSTTMNCSVDAEIKRVTISLARRQLDAPQTIASREDVSVAWLVREAVDKLLRQGAEVLVANRAQYSKVRG